MANTMLKIRIIIGLVGLCLMAMLVVKIVAKGQSNGHNNNDRAMTFYNKGLEQQNKGNLDIAITNYNQAIELDPNLADAYICYKEDYERACSNTMTAKRLIDSDLYDLLVGQGYCKGN